jgi:hypothetical protein
MWGLEKVVIRQYFLEDLTSKDLPLPLEGWGGCRLVAQHLPTMHKTLGLFHSITKKCFLKRYSP